MRRRRKDEKPEGLERWLLTYADVITLLMAFFIMMYSMSVMSVSKFREAAISIRSGFGGLVKGQGRSILGNSGVYSPKPSPINGETAGVSWKVLKPMVNYVERADRDQHLMSIGEDERGIVITMSSDSLLFEPGSADMAPQSRPVLDKIARMIGRTNNLVQIEGHTCDLPPRGWRYPTNWELSTARATEILRYLVDEKGLPSWRFSAAGYGCVRPTAPMNNAVNRSKNRRVQIVILRPEAPAANIPKAPPRRIGNPSAVSFRRRLD